MQVDLTMAQAGLMRGLLSRAINWASLGANDTLFISGGTDSTVYTETLTVQASGSPNGLLVIRQD